jgi:thiol-disulfide isomerase/thioredoxin
MTLSACGLFDRQTLYRELQPATAQSFGTVGARSSNLEAEPTTEQSLSHIQIAADQSPAPESFTLVIPHPEHGDLSEVLAVHARLAAEQGRQPFVEFSAEWCPPCRALEASLDDPLMVEALRGVYLIRLDIDEWEDQILDSEFRVPGIPLFYELDTSGKSTGRAIAGSAWGQDIPRYMAPPLQSFFQGT